MLVDEGEKDRHTWVAYAADDDDVQQEPLAGMPPEGDGNAGREPHSGRGKLLSESVRKVLVGGASALLMTEENIRNALADVRLPKDAANYLLQQTDRTRREMMRIISREVKGAVQRVDLRGELRRALVGLRLDVRASVRFREDRAGDEGPAITFSPRVRRRRRRAEGPARGREADERGAPRREPPVQATTRAAVSPGDGHAPVGQHPASPPETAASALSGAALPPDGRKRP